MLKKILFFIGVIFGSEALTHHLFGAQEKTSYEIVQEWEAPESLNAPEAQQYIREFHDLFPTLFDDPQDDPWYVKGKSPITNARAAVQIQQRVIECHNQRHEAQPNIHVKDTTPRLTGNYDSLGGIHQIAQGGWDSCYARLARKQKANLYRLLARCGLLGAGCVSTAYVLYNKAKKELIAERTKKELAVPSEFVEEAACAKDDDNTNCIKAPVAKEVIARVLHNIRTKPLKEQVSIRNFALFFTLCATIESGFKLYAIHLMRCFG
jgi:hypothetical protein